MNRNCFSYAQMCFIMMLPVIGIALPAASQTIGMPKSMNEFVNWHLDHGVTGTWVHAGVTKDMWVGIPAGIPYASTNTMIYSPKSETLYNSHRMATEDGTVISTGVGLMYWSDELNAPMVCSSGFDMGKPYTGTAVLKGMDSDAIHWEYTENSQGKTTVYSNVMRYTGANTRTQTVRAGQNGEPWITNSVRANPGGNLLKTIKMVGNWREEMADGSTFTQDISWLADGHVLKQQGIYTKKNGSSETDLYLMYWDPNSDHIATMYLDSHGALIHGKVDSITIEDDVVTIISSHEGSRYGGLTMSTQMTQVVDDKTLTTTFQGMSLDGVRHELSWSGQTGVTTRIDH